LKLWTYVFIYVDSLFVRERIYRFAPNLASLFFDTRKRTKQDQNSGKMSWFRFSLRAVPVAETKHNRTASVPKLFVSNRRLQKQRPQLLKTVLGLIPGEDGLCSSKPKHDRRTAPRPKLIASERRLREQGPQHRKLFWVRDLTRMVSVALKLSTWEERRRSKICSYRRDYRN
jgi:hypothetical protein